MIRIGFFGTPSLAASVLSDIINHPGFEVCFVVSNPDKPFGREQELRPTPVKLIATEHGIPTFTPLKVKNNPEFLESLLQYNCDYYIVVAFGQILPLSILEAPKKMCINIHGSILPKYRGASPIQSALLHGENETGVTIMQMSEGMDEGDILKIETIPLSYNETSGTLFEKFGKISGPTLLETILGVENRTIVPQSQDHERATYCTKIDKEDGLIDWTQTAKEIYNIWQAYTPWPGIYTLYQGKRLLLEKIEYISHSGNEDLGEVIRLESGGIGVVCREGILTLSQVKLEGKKSQNIKDFLNGNQNFIGYNFV